MSISSLRKETSILQNVYSRKVGKYGIRRCLPEDLPTVISINWAALPEHYSDSFFEERLRESPETFLVTEDETFTIIGYIMCRIEYGFSHMKRYGLARKGHVVSVAVLEGHRGLGLGRALMEEAMKGMRERGCSEAYLEVRVSNDAAVGLYKNLGFQVVTTHHGYYRDGENAYLMSMQFEQAS
ncbi:MAG: ribosomal protein S18-alanine N-acetyltransferase [Nitrososphaerota archaeon]|nr:ribosomal protein S18-alanine N-acetyltransferase [Nitrososphaerota archaeon]